MGRYEELKDKRVLVTGAASGIGLATARRFAAEGSRVFLVDRDEGALRAALEGSPFAGGARADVSSEAEVQAAFEDLDRTLGGLDVLVSNAGSACATPVWTSPTTSGTG